MATANEITGLYKELLGRAPDSGGLKHYMGTSAQYARSSISGSPERQAYVARQQKAPAKKPGAKKPAAKKAGFSWDNEAKAGYRSLQSFDKSAQNPLDMYNSALDKLGISDIRTRVTDLRQQLLDNENLLRNVEPDVQARLSETLATENQRRRVVAMEQQPLMNTQDIMERSFSSARGEYTDTLAEGKTQAELQFEGQKERRRSLMDRLQIAIDRSKSAEDKRRWQAEYNRLAKKDKEETRRFNLEYALKKQQVEKANAPSGGRSGGGGGGGGGASSVKSSRTAPKSSGSGYIATGGKIHSIGQAQPVDLRKAFASGGLK